MKGKSFKDSLVIGLALFSMFFGAGNLIFPPFLGYVVGDQFKFALLGFLLTGIGLPLLGIIACAQIDGAFEEMASRVGKVFTVGAMIVLTLMIGPIIAVPRTASAAYELGVSTLLPNASALLTAIIYLAVVLAFVLKPTSVIDRIGKILTPVLLFVLIAIIVKGVAVPIGEVATVSFDNPFASAFKEGYNTMDALASVIFASIIISAVKAKGYVDRRSTFKVMVVSALIASVSLIVVYGGLMYLGTQVSSAAGVQFSRTELVIHIASEVFGSLGATLLSIVTLLACLTTAIALLTTSAEFFTKLFKNKIPYHVVAISLTVVSLVMATNNVDQIIEIAAPLLDIIYPGVIVMIILTLLNPWIKEDLVFKVTVYVTVVFSLITTLSSIFQWQGLNDVLVHIPLQSHGFGWIVLAIISAVATLISCYVVDKFLRESQVS